MNALVASALETSLPLIAALWLASVLLLVVSARKFLAGRALKRARTRQPSAEPADAVEPTFALAESALSMADPMNVDASVSVGDATSSREWLDEGATDEYASVDQQPGDAPPTGPTTTPSSTADLREAIRARVSADASATDLGELVRALYLDQSHFTFQTLAALPAEDRDLARRLIEAWLADPSAIEYWEAMYAAVREASPAMRPAQQA